MRLFTLRFPSFLSLLNFRHIIQPRYSRTSILQQTLACECSEVQIELAVYVYQAEVLPNDADESTVGARFCVAPRKYPPIGCAVQR